jgi:hypothetical protein
MLLARRGDTILNDEILSHVSSLVRRHGSDCWWTMDTLDLLPPSMRADAAMSDGTGCR